MLTQEQIKLTQDLIASFDKGIKEVADLAEDCKFHTSYVVVLALDDTPFRSTNGKIAMFGGSIFVTTSLHGAESIAAQLNKKAETTGAGHINVREVRRWAPDRQMALRELQNTLKAQLATVDKVTSNLNVA